MKTIKQRWNAKTPKFWKKIQTIGLSLAGISSVILTAPVSLPVGIVTLAGYLATAGGVVGVISQLTIEDGKNK
jgi:ABC-type xylose transport system permease subunit